MPITIIKGGVEIEFIIYFFNNLWDLNAKSAHNLEKADLLEA